MRFRERYLRRYANADWIAHLVLSTCIAAAISFLGILSEVAADAEAAGTHVVDGYEITVCYFGPPELFYTRFIVLLALLIAAPAAFKQTVSCRLVSGLGLAAAMATYTHAWIESNSVFRSFASADINFLTYPSLRQFAYLYGGTSFDLAVALSTAVCLVLLLERLFEGR